MKNKPRLPDFTTEREKLLRRRYKIECAVDITIIILFISCFILSGVIDGYILSTPISCFFEGFVCLICFLFHIITWKKFGWEQMTPKQFELIKITGNDNKERVETNAMVNYCFLAFFAVTFIVIGIIKLF